MKDALDRSRLAARWIVGVGVLHCAIFLWFGRRVIGAIAADGFWNSIGPARERQVIFWSLLVGVLSIVLGSLASWIVRQGHALPASLGWQLLALTLTCGALMPASGVWLLLVPALLIVAFPTGKSKWDTAPTSS